MMRYPDKAADYKVALDIFDGRAEKTVASLNYRVHSNPAHMALNGNTIIHVERHGMDLDGAKTHGPLEDISLISAEILSGLKLEIAKEGGIARIRNHKGILKSWNEDIRFRLERTYPGEVVETLLAFINRQVNDEQLFIRSLERDPFLFFYLLPHNAFPNVVPVYWLGGFPVLFASEAVNGKEKGIVDLLLEPAPGQAAKLKDYYSAIYGDGSMDIKTKVRYFLQAGCMKRFEASFGIIWNGTPVKNLNIDIALI